MVVATLVSWRTSRVAEVTGCDGADDAGVDAVSDPITFVLLVPICKQTSTSPSSAHTPRGFVFSYFQSFGTSPKRGVERNWKRHRGPRGWLGFLLTFWVPNILPLSSGCSHAADP